MKINGSHSEAEKVHWTSLHMIVGIFRLLCIVKTIMDTSLLATRCCLDNCEPTASTFLSATIYFDSVTFDRAKTIMVMVNSVTTANQQLQLCSLLPYFDTVAFCSQLLANVSPASIALRASRTLECWQSFKLLCCS